MNNAVWKTEFWRIVLVLLIAFLGWKLSDQGFASLTLALMGYVAWLLYKLQQLQQWLNKGAKPKNLPDNSGLWESITQQIQVMQKQSNQRKKRLGKLLKRSQGIISGLPYATVVLNRNNEIDWANKSSSTLLNIDIKKDRGQRIDNLIRVPELQKLLAKNSDEEIECSLPQSAGRQLVLQLITVQKDLKLLIARDITERENVMQMRKNFIANASHELRTPLTVIAGYLEIMQEDDNLPENLQMAVLAASDQSIRMQSIIEDLLTLSRLENSELSVDDNTVINMFSVLQGICHDEATLIEGDSHTLETNIDSTLKIKGSEEEIISACSNLIHNAIRHTQDGTKITVEWKKTALGEACLVVKDTGQGIPVEHISHLTERFYRVDKGRSRDKGGTGLGLAIVQHIILRHGGKLDIQSKIGEGSTFTICFSSERMVQ